MEDVALPARFISLFCSPRLGCCAAAWAAPGLRLGGPCIAAHRGSAQPRAGRGAAGDTIGRSEATTHSPSTATPRRARVMRGCHAQHTAPLMSPTPAMARSDAMVSQMKGEAGDRPNPRKWPYYLFYPLALPPRQAATSVLCASLSRPRAVGGPSRARAEPEPVGRAQSSPVAAAWPPDSPLIQATVPCNILPPNKSVLISALLLYHNSFFFSTGSTNRGSMATARKVCMGGGALHTLPQHAVVVQPLWQGTVLAASWQRIMAAAWQ